MFEDVTSLYFLFIEKCIQELICCPSNCRLIFQMVIEMASGNVRHFIPHTLVIKFMTFNDLNGKFSVHLVPAFEMLFQRL